MQTMKNEGPSGENSMLRQVLMWADTLAGFGYTVIPPSEEKLMELAEKEGANWAMLTARSPLAAKRIECCITTMELAEKVGVARQTITNWESGRSYPSLYNQRLLADALGIQPRELRQMLPIGEGAKRYGHKKKADPRGAGGVQKAD